MTRQSLFLCVSAFLLCMPGLGHAESCSPAKTENVYRFATFNTFLNRSAQFQLRADLANADDQMEAGGADRQIKAVAEIIQRVRADVLLLNEFDFDLEALAAQRFLEKFLAVPQGNQKPIAYPFVYSARSNTGVDSGLDLDGDGSIGGPGDALGYGTFPGQYGMLLLSKYPIDKAGVRTFRKFLWRDMPGAKLPDDQATQRKGDYYDAQTLDVFRLSSKSHWDVPVRIAGSTVHILAAHPTPPVFDGPEDRNGLRNHDEIRLWADYVGTAETGQYLIDDKGIPGGLGLQRFVIMGDYNADPLDGDSTANAIGQLLDHNQIDATLVPKSAGAMADAMYEKQANVGHHGDAAADTGDFNPKHLGNLRLDYVLPSQFGFEAVCAGVFWPKLGQDGSALVGAGYPVVSSDHRLVWMDLRIEP